MICHKACDKESAYKTHLQSKHAIFLLNIFLKVNITETFIYVKGRCILCIPCFETTFVFKKDFY